MCQVSARTRSALSLIVLTVLFAELVFAVSLTARPTPAHALPDVACAETSFHLCFSGRFCRMGDVPGTCTNFCDCPPAQPVPTPAPPPPNPGVTLQPQSCTTVGSQLLVNFWVVNHSLITVCEVH